MASKKVYAIKTPDGNPVRAEEAWKDANGGLLTAKATKVSSTTTDTIFVNDGTGNLKDSGKSIKDIVNTYVCGGIEFSGTASAGTLVGDFEGLTQAQLMKRWPFSALYIDDVDSYSSDGTAYGHKDSYLVMPNMWRKTTHSDDGSSTFMIANYQVDETYSLAYPSDFKELCLAVYMSFYDSTAKVYKSVSGQTPSVWQSVKKALSYMPYYKRGGSLRRAEPLDYRVLALYQVLAIIYMGTRNSQNVYVGIVGYSYSTGYPHQDVTDEPSRLTGVTELETSAGYMPHKVVSGEITGTSFTESLASGKRPFKLLGVENPYGCAWQCLYGLSFYNGKCYAYAGSRDDLSATDLAPSDTNAYYADTGVTAATSNNYEKTFADANGYPVCTAIGAGTGTSVGDRLWYNASADTWVVPFFGGVFYRNLECGLFALDVAREWGHGAESFVARLSFER